MDRQAIDVHGRIAFSNANRALPKTGQKRRWRRVRFCTFATCQLHRAMSLSGVTRKTFAQIEFFRLDP